MFLVFHVLINLFLFHPGGIWYARAEVTFARVLVCRL